MRVSFSLFFVQSGACLTLSNATEARSTLISLAIWCLRAWITVHTHSMHTHYNVCTRVPNINNQKKKKKEKKTEQKKGAKNVFHSHSLVFRLLLLLLVFVFGNRWLWLNFTFILYGQTNDLTFSWNICCFFATRNWFVLCHSLTLVRNASRAIH